MLGFYHDDRRNRMWQPWRCVPRRRRATLAKTPCPRLVIADTPIVRGQRFL